MRRIYNKSLRSGDLEEGFIPIISGLQIPQKQENVQTKVCGTHEKKFYKH